MDRPRFSIKQAAGVLEEFYCLSGNVRELPSERDQNFYIKTKEGGPGYVLKIANSSEQQKLLTFQNQVIEHLEERLPRFNWPRILPSKSGEKIAGVTHSSGTRHFARVLTYLPGRLMARVQPHKSELLQSLGLFLGRMDAELLHFSRPVPPRELKWDMRRASSTARRFLHFISDSNQRKIVEFFIGRFEEAQSLLSPLRTGLIHNDANDYNVLVGDSSPDPFGRFNQVTGIIDFGDFLTGYIACEPAVAAAYAMMEKKNPLEAAAHVISGYHSTFPLTEKEIEVIYHLVCMRLCLTVTISAQQHKLEEDNEYLTISEQPAWELLHRLLDIHPRLAHYTFRDACGCSPCPHTPEIVRWLQSSREKPAPVVNPDPRTHHPHVFDFSVASPEMGQKSLTQDRQTVTRFIFDRMTEQGTESGIGRYDEARLSYTGDQFKAEGNEALEWRSLHLGMDIFQRPDAPVFAPFEGHVHSFRDNSAPQDYGPTIILEHRTEKGLAFYTLYGHLSRRSLSNLSEGKRVKKGEKIGKIGTADENGGWPPHLHFQLITDLLGRKGEFPGVALPRERGLWLSLSPDPNLILGIPLQRFPSRSWEKKDILLFRQQHLCPNLSISYQKPLKIVRGFLQYLYDEDGRSYLDGVNNVPHVGHCHPRVVKALEEQTAVLNSNTRYLHHNLVEYAKRLSDILPEPLCVFYFVNSGSEANDLALRLAWAHTQRKDVIAVEGGYHGNLSSLVEISSYKFDGPGGKGAPAYVHPIPMPDVYRGLYRKSDPEAGIKYARHVQKVLNGKKSKGRSIAAFICEPLLGCAGQIIPPEGFMAEAFRLVRQAGGVCVADEVQVGFGRVGTHFWGFQTQGVVPDIVTLGKPIGNGHPLGAVVTTKEIAASFDTGMEYFNTYGGNPVSCAAGLAVLDVIQEEKLQENALRTGEYLKKGLEKLKSKHALIGDVRGLGLFIGVELVLDRKTLKPATQEAGYVIERMKDLGILISTDGPWRNVLKIKPPLLFSRKNADFFLETLDRVLKDDVLKSWGKG